MVLHAFVAPCPIHPWAYCMRPSVEAMGLTISAQVMTLSWSHWILLLKQSGLRKKTFMILSGGILKQWVFTFHFQALLLSTGETSQCLEKHLRYLNLNTCHLHPGFHGLARYVATGYRWRCLFRVRLRMHRLKSPRARQGWPIGSYSNHPFSGANSDFQGG